jgi:hypothetical protein
MQWRQPVILRRRLQPIAAMDSPARRVFWFVLRHFEAGDEPYTHKPMNRKILLAVGVLFGILGSASAYMAVDRGGLAYALPVVVFFGASVVCLIVAFLGSDRAVAKIWGNR